jgi:hypothetical protein
MKYKSIKLVFAFLLFASVCHAQKMQIESFEKIPLNDSIYYLRLKIKVSNDTNSPIILPTPIEPRPSGNVVNTFYQLRPSRNTIPLKIDKSLSDTSTMVPAKLDKKDVITINPKSSSSFEINTNFFARRGLLPKTNKKVKITLIYKPWFQSLQYFRHQYLDKDIIDVDFYSKNMKSQAIEI